MGQKSIKAVIERLLLYNNLSIIMVLDCLELELGGCNNEVAAFQGDHNNIIEVASPVSASITKSFGASYHALISYYIPESLRGHSAACIQVEDLCHC